jgi:predicted transcriptional regulator
MAKETQSHVRIIGDIMTRRVVTVGSKDPVVDVTRLMTSKNIGCVIVMESGKVIGILTERDLLNRVFSGKKDISRMVVAEAMTSPVVTIDSKTSVYYAAKMMEKNFFRRLPVVDDGRLVGVVTQTDVNKAMTSSMIDLVPRVESNLKTTPVKCDTETGRSYMIEEKKSVKSIEMFTELVKHGHMGLCICRTNPENIKKTYDLQSTPIVWVTDIKTNEQSITPTDLVSLSNVISEFVQKAKKGVVFIEALTYLIDRNDFTRVLHAIQHIRDVVSESDSCLIINVDPVVLSEKELELLSQEMDEVKFRAF